MIDAESGATTLTAAFATDAETSFADLSADQIDADRIVGVGRAEVERELGRLP